MSDSTWTYGAEHELADWAPRDRLPKGYGIDTKDYTMVNSDGIAVDPKGVIWPFGGEINTPPTDTISGQCELLSEIVRLFPQASVNYRSNLHIHIRVPGLINDLDKLKQLQKFVNLYVADCLKVIDPIPEPIKEEFTDEEEYKGARKRYNRRKRSHKTIIPQSRVDAMLEAQTIREFFEREVPHSKGRPMWHLQPRAAVNIRQLLETDTIEFRHFPGTLNPKELESAFCWCRDFLGLAFDNVNPIEYLKKEHLLRKRPKFHPYVHWMELRYRATCHDGSVPKDQIKSNIQKILAGEFDEQLDSHLSR